MAIARLGQQLYLVDERGVIIDEFGPQYREFDLPIVDGLVRRRPSRRAARSTPRGVRADRAVPRRRSRRGRTSRQRVSQIDVCDPRDVVVLLDDDPALLHLGDARFVERLHDVPRDWRRRCASGCTEIDYVDLRFDERRRIVRSRADGGECRTEQMNEAR